MFIRAKSFYLLLSFGSRANVRSAITRNANGVSDEIMFLIEVLTNSYISSYTYNKPISSFQLLHCIYPSILKSWSAYLWIITFTYSIIVVRIVCTENILNQSKSMFVSFAISIHILTLSFYHCDKIRENRPHQPHLVCFFSVSVSAFRHCYLEEDLISAYGYDTNHIVFCVKN